MWASPAPYQSGGRWLPIFPDERCFHSTADAVILVEGATGSLYTSRTREPDFLSGGWKQWGMRSLDEFATAKLAGLEEAPCQLAVFADAAPAQGRGLGRRTMPEVIAYSAVAAVHTLWLAARAEGIGMGWVSILDPARVAASLDVPADWTLIGYFCLGYAEQEDDLPALERERWERRQASSSVVIRR